jgi:hypothetical protein
MQRSDYIPVCLSGVIQAQTQSCSKRTVAKLFRQLTLIGLGADANSAIHRNDAVLK